MTHTPAPLSQQPDGPVESSHLDMTTFLVSSAHDMKNSISVMTAYLEAALREMDPATAPASVNEMTHQALYEAKRLNDRLIQILALYKINEGLYPFDPEDVDLAAFAKEVIARVSPLAQAKGIKLEVELLGAERYWYFDYELILSVVIQALHNAVKYTRDQVKLSVQTSADQIEIRVGDNGAGFPPFMLEHGFPVRQGIDARTGSTGLGLYFSAKVAAMHKHRDRVGQTRLENCPAMGGGCFVLTLP